MLDLIDQDGTGAAIEHLRGFDYGEETTSAALANEHVYDVPPTGANTRMVTEGEYALTYSHTFGHVALYRSYIPLTDTTAASEAAQLSGAGSAEDAAGAEDVQRALEERRDRVRGDGSWFTPDRIAQIKRDRGLGR